MDEKTKAQKGREHILWWARLDFVFIQLLIEHLLCVSPAVGVRTQPWIRQMSLLPSRSWGSKLVGSGREQTTEHINQLTSHRDKCPNCCLREAPAQVFLPTVLAFSQGENSVLLPHAGDEGLQSATLQRPADSLSTLTVSSLPQEPWSSSVVGGSSSCKGSQRPWWRWSSIYTLQRATLVPHIGRFWAPVSPRGLEVWTGDEWDRYEGTRLTFKAKWDWIPTSLICLFYM